MKFIVKGDILEHNMMVGETYEYLYNHDMASFILTGEGKILCTLSPSEFKRLLKERVFELEGSGWK